MSDAEFPVSPDEAEVFFHHAEEVAEIESVFSRRSGIRDPLVRQLGKEASVEMLVDNEPIDKSIEEAEDEDGIDPTSQKRRLLKSRRQLERARRRQMNYLQKRREQKRRAMFYQRLRLFFKFCFALLLIALFWELVNGGFWNYNALRFSLNNHKVLQERQVTFLLRPWLNKPLYAIDTGQISEEILTRYPLIQAVSIRRQLFPAKLDLTVFEKHPWAEVYAKPEDTRPYAVVAQQEMISLMPYAYEPQAQNASTEAVEKILLAPQSKIDKTLLPRLEQLSWQAKKIKGLHLQSVDARTLNQPQGVILKFELPGVFQKNLPTTQNKSNPITSTLQKQPKPKPVVVSVWLGQLNSTALKRLSRLSPMVPKIKEMHAQIEGIDLRWEKQATFHMKATPATS